MKLFALFRTDEGDRWQDRGADLFDLFFHRRHLDDTRPPASQLRLCADCGHHFTPGAGDQEICQLCTDRAGGVGLPDLEAAKTPNPMPHGLPRPAPPPGPPPPQHRPVRAAGGTR